MRALTRNWYEAKVRYDKNTEDGKQKKVNELYYVEGMSISDAEVVVTENIAPFSCGEFEVISIAKSPIGEIYLTDREMDDKFYKFKLKFITIDEKTGNEKLTSKTYIMQGNNVPKVSEDIGEMMKGSASDYIIAGITDTRIMDVIERNVLTEQK